MHASIENFCGTVLGKRWGKLATVTFLACFITIGNLLYKLIYILKMCILNITFSYPCNSRESIVLLSNFRKGDFDEFSRYEVPSILKS